MAKDKKADPKPKKKSGERPSSSGLLLFITAFVLCLLVFAGGGFLWWHFADPELPFLNGDEPTTATTAPVTDTARFDQNDRFSVAVYITDDNGILQTVTLLMAQPDTNTVSTVGFPAELSLSAEDETDTLLRQYTNDGVEAAQSALGMYLTNSIDYHVIFTYSEAESFFTQLVEELIFTLPVDVDEQSADGSFSIHLTAGEQALTPRQVSNLLRYNNWQGGRRERAQMHASLVSAYINQFLTDTRDLKNDYQLMYSLVESDLSGERFSVIEPMLSHLAACNKGGICTNQPVIGIFEGAGSTLRFIPDGTMINTVTTTLR